LAKDRKPEPDRTRGGASRAGAAGGKGGRARPPVTNVVAPQRPWGLIAAAVAVLVFAAAVLTYAVLQVNEAESGRVDSADEIQGLQTFDYAAGQQHVTTPVTYEQSPPVGGPHDGEWADCTGTVYDVQIRQATRCRRSGTWPASPGGWSPRTPGRTPPSACSPGTTS
jgi:hypothetical protein